MISRSHRLTKEQFSALLSQKGLVTIYNSLGNLKYISGNKGFAVVTSGKHEKRAPVRNKVRRRIYSIVRGAEVSFSGIFYVAKQAYTFDYKTTKKLFEELLSKITK